MHQTKYVKYINTTKAIFKLRRNKIHTSGLLFKAKKESAFKKRHPKTDFTTTSDPTNTFFYSYK